MKHVFTLIICAFLMGACTTTKNVENQAAQLHKTHQNLPSILEIEAVGKQSYQQVVIANGVAIIKNSRKGNQTKQKLSKKQLEALTQAYQFLDVAQLNDYVSEPRFNQPEETAIAVLKISNQGKTYISNDFDTANPPEQFKALVACVQQIINE